MRVIRELFRNEPPIELGPDPIAVHGGVVRVLRVNKANLKPLGRSIMRDIATTLCAATAAIVLIGGAGLTSAPAEAATAADKAALKEATAVCKAEAKEKKINWPASRKFVSTCVAKAVKLTPAQLQKIAVNHAIAGCKAEAKAKKIHWPASRKFVGTCLSNALKDYSLDLAQLRRELNIAGLRNYTPQEAGCMQNVYCED
jgi:hypothetical protein